MKRILSSMFLMLCWGIALAEPAPWYKWRSALSDNDVCAQFSPGEGWVRIQGPFQDSSCRKPGVPH